MTKVPKKFKKSLAILVILTFMLTLVPVTAFAVTAPDPVAAVNSAADTAETTTALVDNAVYFQIEIGAGSDYALLSGQGQDTVAGSVYDNKPYADAPAVQSAFNSAVTAELETESVAAVNDATDVANTRSALETYAQGLNIDTGEGSKYVLLSEQGQDTVAGSVYSNKPVTGYNAALAVQNAFNNAVTAELATESLAAVNSAVYTATRTALEHYHLGLGIDTGTGSDYASLSELGRDTVAQSVYNHKGTGYPSVGAVKIAFDSAVTALLDAAALNNAFASLTFDTIKNTNTDPSGVTANLNLTVTDEVYGVSISWASSNPSVVSTAGVVTRPNHGLGNAVVTLTATLTKGTQSTTKEIEITVIENSSSPSSSSGGGGGGSAPTTSVTVGNGGTVPAGKSATVSADGLNIVIPANAMSSDFKVTVNTLSNISGLSFADSSKLIGNVFEILKDKTGSFDKAVTLTLPFDVSKVDTKNYNVAIYWYNEDTKAWVKLDDISVDLASGKVSGSVTHFTKFAVLATEKPLAADIDGHWAFNAINQLLKSKTVAGYPDGTFKPNSSITRAEFVTMLVKAYGLDVQAGKTFSDTEKHWAKDYISTAVAAGIVSGYNDTTFGANDNITREQMAVMVAKASKLAAGKTTVNFADSSSISNWANDAVGIASSNQIIKGYPDNTFRPQGKATRAEAVMVIVQAQAVK